MLRLCYRKFFVPTIYLIDSSTQMEQSDVFLEKIGRISSLITA